MKKETLFQCPVCAKALFQEEKRYRCQKGHNFDIAGRGYVNLFLPSHKGAGNPGDSKEMLQSRRKFLNQGYYEEFSNRLNQLILQMILAQKGKSISVLDTGCGEGYYIWRLKNNFTEVLGKDYSLSLYGTDVSKIAINYAARRDRSIYFAVASSYHLPLLTGVMDYILCLFAPRDEQEFKRVLKPGGKLIVAAPGPRHLYSLRRVLYEDPEPIGERGTVTNGFTLISQKDVVYELNLKSVEDRLNLLRMTPFSRHTTPKAVEGLKNLEEFKTDLEIKIMVYRKL